MKYYTWDLILQGMCGTCSEEFTKRWNESCQKSHKAFEKIESKLAPEVAYLWNHGGFHDALLQNISLQSKKDQTEMRMYLSNVYMNERDDAGKIVERKIPNGTLIYKNVKKVETTFADLAGGPYGMGEYLYGELYGLKKGLLVHNFVFTEHNELYVECEEIQWVSESER